MSRFEDLLEDFFYRPDEDVGALFEAASAPDAQLAPVEEESPREYLAFRLTDETYALPIETVREIVKVPPLTEVPRGEPELLGVMNLRGEVLPVYDLKLRLRLSQKTAPVAGPDADLTRLPRSARILILRDEERGDAGVLVDLVQEVVRLRPSTLEAPPRGLSSERSAISGIGRRREQLYILLDLAQALS